MQPCRGCRNYRGDVIPPVRSCKESEGGRLCRQIDVSLLAHGIRRREDLVETHDSVEIGYRAAAEYVRDADAEADTTYQGFRALLIEGHRRLFQYGIPSIAGRFRTEPISVGGHGQHRFEGVSPSQIDPELERLWTKLVRDRRPSEGVGSVARWSAQFLERFFRVHPFVDGNGRLGRMVISRVAASAGLSYDWESAPHGERRGKRKYLFALQYAHQHAPESDHPGQDPRKPAFAPLTAWLARRLVVVGRDEEPPSFESS